MTRLRIVAVVTLAVGIVVPAVLAQRRGGAVQSGVRGAMVGGLVNGNEGAQKGAKIGVVTGATRTVVQNVDQRRVTTAEAQARAQYQTTAQYQNAQHSNFAVAPPEVFVASPAAETPVAAATPPSDKPVESVIRKDGKPIVAITYPADWKATAGAKWVSATSADGHGWSVMALVDAKDKEAAIAKAKQGLEKYLDDIQYDEPTETERGALVLTGTGKGKKSGVEVVFAVGTFEPVKGQLAGAAFIVDKDLEEHYKEIVRYTCQTIRGPMDAAAAPAKEPTKQPAAPAAKP